MKKIYSFSFLFFGISFSHATTVLVTDLSEFNTAVGNKIPGDTIKMKDGTWTDIQLEFYANGTAVKPIVLMAETPGNVLITGSSTLSIWGEYLVVRDLNFSDGQSVGTKSVIQFRKDSNNLANNCRLTNTRILDFNPVSSSTNYKWVSIYGKNNRVDHCHFAGKNHQGALLTVWLDGQPDYHRIDHNYFSDIPDLGENGGKTIRIGTSTYSMTDSYTTVEYNLFESCDGEIEIISNKSGFNVSRYNTFRNNNGMLTLRQGNDCEVYGNFFFGRIDKSSGGVRIIGERHKVYNNYFQDLNQGLRSGVSMMNGVPDSPLNRYFQVKNAQVVNNTFVGCQESIAIGEGSDSERTLRPLDCIIANNAIQGTTRGKAIVYTDTPINMTYEANYIEGTIGVPDAAFLGILLAGAGGGSIAYVADKKFNRPKKKDTPSEDEGEIIG